MGVHAGKHKRTDNENNRKRTNSVFRFSMTHKREEQQRLLNRNDEQNEVSSSTTLYDLPLEMLDIILQKSYLHWILNSSTKHRDEEVIRSLISVDVCFNRRITKQRFKREIWRYLTYLYKERKKRSAIIRNNRNYLLENIQPNEELMAALLSLHCITEVQSHFIQLQLIQRDMNAELLYIMRSIDKTKFSNFAKCLRGTHQTTSARVIENGGVVIKVQVKNCGRPTTCTVSMDPQLLHRSISDFRDRTKPRSYRTDELLSQLREGGIEILDSQLDRQSVVVWFWCQSQAALENIQRLYESNQLKDVLFNFANIRQSASEVSKSRVIKIDCNQFRKTVVLCPISINFSNRLHVERNESVCGVTKLRNEIYVLCRPRDQHFPQIIRVFEDRNPFRLQRKIEIKEIKYPADIGSSEKENCLYVSELLENCVWKITRETDDKDKIIKWLTTEYTPWTLSVSRDGQLLMISRSPSILMIYGSDAELNRSIQLPRDINIAIHAVETSIGNFIILDRWVEKEKMEGKSGSTWGNWKTNCGLSELTRDGHMVRSFIASNKTQKLIDPFYLSLDSDDRVFVADLGNDSVILFDSDLKSNRLFCPTEEEEEEEEEETKIRWPHRLCYDNDRKQLIVGGNCLEGGVNVYDESKVKKTFSFRYPRDK